MDVLACTYLTCTFHVYVYLNYLGLLPDVAKRKHHGVISDPASPIWMVVKWLALCGSVIVSKGHHFLQQNLYLSHSIHGIGILDLGDFYGTCRWLIPVPWIQWVDFCFNFIHPMSIWSPILYPPPKKKHKTWTPGNPKIARIEKEKLFEANNQTAIFWGSNIHIFNHLYATKLSTKLLRDP